MALARSSPGGNGCTRPAQRTALADSTRRQILEELRAGELSAGDIARKFPISGPSVSRHLGLLKTAGLIRERREANHIFYSLAKERLALCVSRFLSTVCPDQFVFRQHARKIQKSRGSTASGRLPRRASSNAVSS